MTKWPEVLIPEVLDFKEGPGILAKDFRDSGVPLIRLAGLKPGASLIAGCNYLEPEMVAQKWSQFSLELGDVVLSTSASLGEVAVVGPEGVGGIPYTGIIRFRPKGGGMSPRFIPVALTSGSFRRQIESMGVGSVIRHFGPMHLRSMTVEVPPRDVQEAIADIKEALDERIAHHRRTIAVNAELLDAIAERWAADLPTVPLSSLVMLNRATVSPAVLGGSIVHHYSLPAFDEGGLPQAVSASEIKSNKTRVSRQSVLVSRLNPRIERMWWVTPDAGVPALASTEFACLEAVDAVELAAVWLGVRAPTFRTEVLRRVTGTSGSHQRVRPDDLLAIDVMDMRLIPRDVVAGSASLLSQAAQARVESHRLVLLRETLLPELLAGRVRLKDDGRG